MISSFENKTDTITVSQSKPGSTANASVTPHSQNCRYQTSPSDAVSYHIRNIFFWCVLGVYTSAVNIVSNILRPTDRRILKNFLWFYGITTLVGYPIPNPHDTYIY